MSPITRERLVEVVRLGAERDDAPVEASKPTGRPVLAFLDRDLMLASLRTVGFLPVGEAAPSRAWKPEVHGLPSPIVLTPSANTWLADPARDTSDPPQQGAIAFY